MDQFDGALHQSARRPLVMGQPYRLRALRRALTHVMTHRGDLWITSPGEIAGYCAGVREGLFVERTGDGSVAVRKFSIFLKVSLETYLVCIYLCRTHLNGMAYPLK